MSTLNNEMEYREWFIVDYRKMSDEDWLMHDPQDIEEEIMKMEPLSYPCIASVLNSHNLHPDGAPSFSYIYSE